MDVKERLLKAAKDGETTISFSDAVSVTLEDGVYKVGDWEGSEVDDAARVVTEALEVEEKQYKPPTGWNDPQSWLGSEKGAEKIRAAAWEAMGSSVTSCITHMEDRVDDAGAFCASLKDAIEGPEWRKGPREKKKEEDGWVNVEKVIVDEGDEVVLYSKDKSKVLGRYPYGKGKKYKDKEAATDAAEKREREVQFFKHRGKEWLAVPVVEKETSLNQVQDAFYNTFNPPGVDAAEGPRVWTKEVFPAAVVAEDAGQLYRVPYTTEGDVIKFANRGDWEKGKMVWEAEEESSIALSEAQATFWRGKEARMFLVAAKAWIQRSESETTVWKEGDRRFYLGLVSLAIKDKEGELVTMEGADFSIDLARRYKYRSGLYIRHVVPESLVGRSLRERRIGPFWMELGEFENTPLADYAYRILENDKERKWKISIGFITPKKQAIVGRYTRLLKFDSTITQVPAQPFTAMLALMKEGGRTMNGTKIQRLMSFLNPETDEQQEDVAKMLADIFEVDKEEIVAVAKQTEDVGKVEALIATLEDVDLKDALSAVLKKGKGKPWNEGDDEDEEEKRKKKELEEEGIEAAITKAIKPVLERIEAIEGTASAMKELREALLTRSKDHVKPSETATTVADGDAILKKLEKMLDPEAGRGKHPLSAFAHGPAPAEGG